MQNDFAIIGAGSSGLAAAHTLQDAGYRVALYEKSRGVGGRAATRTRDGFIYDHGAQYIKGGSPVSDTLITDRFRADDLLDIAKPVWIFDGQGHIWEGDPRQNADPKWNYRGGLSTLSHLMARGLDIHFEVRISRIAQTGAGWNLYEESAKLVGTANHVLITIPATQASELIAKSEMEPALREAIVEHLGKASYNPLLSVMLGYQPRPEARPYYALVNTDKAHPISWLAWEHEKAPERTPPNSGLLIAQMAPQYSCDHWHTPDQDTYADVAHLVAALIDEPLPEPIFTDIQRWRYALPATKADASALNALTMPHNLAFCGDAFVGGRVHLALEHGIAVARDYLS